jgi:ADP-ribose pyrophosphatase
VTELNFHEETLKSDAIYSGRIMDIVLDRVRLQSGKITTREIVKHPGAVAVIPLLGDKIIMVRQYRYATSKILLEVPAGTLREGEEPEECARRELLEETGYLARRLKLMFQCYVAPGYSSEIVYIYLATQLSQQTQDPEEDEFIEVVKIDLSGVLQMIRRNEIRDAKTIGGILYLDRYLALKRNDGNV